MVYKQCNGQDDDDNDDGGGDVTSSPAKSVLAILSIWLKSLSLIITLFSY